MTNLITPRALFSPLFLQSCYVIHESGSDNSFQRYGHSKFSKQWSSCLGLMRMSLDIYITDINTTRSIHYTRWRRLRNRARPTSSSLTVWVYLHSNFRGKTHVFWNVRNGPSRSSKVVDFGTNRKRVWYFLLVINGINLGPILPRFRDIAGFLLRTTIAIPREF